MSKRVEAFRNILVIALLIGLVLSSWLLGHILRFSIPALWHPPVQETNPQNKYGVEFDGNRRMTLLLEVAPVKEHLEIISIQDGQDSPPGECRGLTYFTSLPAKCLSMDGRLVQVRRIETNFILFPVGK